MGLDVFERRMIKIREAESTRQRIIRQKETKQEKANRLQIIANL